MEKINFGLKGLFPQGKRIEHLDVARALCMLWIVGVWHMCSGYLGIAIDKNDYARNLTYGVLSLFFFISGVLSGKRKLKGSKEVWGFIAHKFWGLYPLYFLSCIGFIALKSFKSTTQIITSILCVGEFFTPMIKTIWFVEIVFLFFLITPLFTYEYKIWYKLGAFVLIYGIFLIDYYTLRIADDRIIRYMPAYVAGLYAYSLAKEKRKAYVSALIFILATAALLLLTVYGNNKIWYVATLIGYIGAIAVYFMAELLANFKPVCVITTLLAYASTFAFLFHRQFYGIMKSLLHVHRFKKWQAYAIVLPLMLVCSFVGQKIYDIIVKKIKSNTKKG